MHKYFEALKIIESLRLNLGVEEIPLANCHGRILSKSLTAPFPSPSFTNSAMDGIALKHADGENNPHMKTQGFVFARSDIDFKKFAYKPGHCVQIMTGAPLPEWADTVVPVEQITLLQSDQLIVNELSPKGANIRRIGEDIETGQPLFSERTYLNAESIMVCANFGLTHLSVYKRPDVVLLCSGDELKEIGQDLTPGSIYNSSKYFLLAALAQVGLSVRICLNLADDLEKAKGVLANMLDFDQPTLILSTGAVSAGEKDFIPDLAKSMGFEQIFHKVAVRPGKPLFLAKKHEIYWFGMPGNPISTVTSWHFFVRPFLRSAAFFPPIRLEKAVISEDLHKPEHLCCFYRGLFDGISIKVSSRQGSAHLLASTEANAYIVVLEGKSEIKAGTTVDVLRI